MQARLTPDELRSLRALARGSVRQRIDSAHARKFLELGLARATIDGVAVTSRGRAQVGLPEPRVFANR
jgi:hypothetical protein